MNRIEDYHSNVSSTYLTDESGITGTAKAIFFPETQKELQDIVAFARQEHQHVVIQGARTGFNAGAVPDGGFIVNLSKMSAVTGFRYDEQRQEGMITVQAGCTLEQIHIALQRKQLDIKDWDAESQNHWKYYKNSRKTLCFFPNPTETSATIGELQRLVQEDRMPIPWGKYPNILNPFCFYCPTGAFYICRKACSLRIYWVPLGLTGSL